MWEEDQSVMEKKGSSRQSSASQPKGNGCSAENNGNKFPRNTRKREPAPNNRGGLDNNSNGSRKPSTQKWRSAGDKRPRSRTFNPLDRQREEVAEYGIDSSNYRSKKGNLNHLLNFSFAPREVDSFVGGSVQGFRRTKTGRIRFDKKRFLQANCQFIVQDVGDYEIHSADPDTLVDWDLIELVRLFSFEKPLCPICLDSPVAAKVTRCGHIYCWSCILHLLSLEDGTWAECPICYSPVVDKDLRSAEPVVVKPYKVGDVITMKLMKREPGSTYSIPKDKWQDRNGIPHRINDDESITRFVKLLIASPSEILDRVIDREKTSLQTQFIDAEVSEVCFIETALVQLKEREDILSIKAQSEKGLHKGRSNKQNEDVHRNSDNLSSDNSDTNLSCSYDENIPSRQKTVSISSITSLQSDEYPTITAGRFNTFSESSVSDSDHPTNDIHHEVDILEVGSEDVSAIEGACANEMDELIHSESSTMTEMLEDPQGAKKKPKNKQVYASKNGYFSFQASNGQQIYIHNINSRCLTHEYGSLESSPPDITATIVDLRSMNMTEELRARTKYLNHLPLSCEFLLVELALKPPILSRKTLDLFQSEIDQKRRLRQRKVNKENLWEKKVCLEEKKKMGIYPGLNISLESEYQFPSYRNTSEHPGLTSTADNYVSQSPHHSQSTETSPVHITGLSLQEEDPLPMSSPEDNHNSTVSFAQMLKHAPAKPQQPVWPKLPAKVDAFPALGGSTGVTSVMVDSDGSEIEDYVPVPAYGQSFSNAIQAALDSAAAKSTVKTPKQKTGGKNKKKSKKTKVLFSTSMTRGKE